jgi:hypothetical protein
MLLVLFFSALKLGLKLGIYMVNLLPLLAYFQHQLTLENYNVCYLIIVSISFCFCNVS